MTLTIVIFFFCYITLFAIKNKLQSKDQKKNPSKDYAIQFKEEGLK